MGTRINTIMQTCFFAISGVLPRDAGDRADQARDREDLQEARRRRRPAQLRGRGRDARPPPRGDGAGVGDRDAPSAADRPRRGARFRQARHRGHARQPGRPAAGQRVPGRRHVADRHGAVGEAEHRHRDSGLGRGALHPVQQVRAGLPARGDPRQGLRSRPRSPGAPATFKSVPYKGPDFTGQYTVQVAPEDCTGCSLCVMMCPAKDKAQPAPQGDRHDAADAAARGGARATTRSSSACRKPTARTSGRTSRARSSCSRSSSTRARAPAAARRRTSS